MTSDSKEIGTKEIGWSTNDKGALVGRVFYWIWKGGRRRYSDQPFPPNRSRRS